MKQNVDLTLNHDFQKDTQKLKSGLIPNRKLQMWRHERCDECGRPIQMPWKDYCNSCEAFFARIVMRKIPCWYQLDYPKPDRKGTKYKCRQQLGDPNCYQFKQWCHNQLIGVRR